MKKQQTLCRLFAAWLLSAAVAPAVADVPGDLVFQREDLSEAGVFPPSIFQHWKHRINYRCDACHDSLFEMKKGAAKVTMEMINAGQSCGACHNGDVAFDGTYVNCERCHRLPAE